MELVFYDWRYFPAPAHTVQTENATVKQNFYTTRNTEKQQNWSSPTCIPMVKCNKWVMSSVHHRVTHSVPLGVHQTSQVKFCLIKIPLCRTRPATHVLFCKRPERMKALCGAKMIKQISRTSFSSASKIVPGLLVIPGKINTGTPAILGLFERLCGWLALH